MTATKKGKILSCIYQVDSNKSVLEMYPVKHCSKVTENLFWIMAALSARSKLKYDDANNLRPACANRTKVAYGCHIKTHNWWDIRVENIPVKQEIGADFNKNLHSIKHSSKWVWVSTKTHICAKNVNDLQKRLVIQTKQLWEYRI